MEELLFYAMGPVAMVLVYACADERWLSRYNPKDDLLDLKLIQLSPRLAIVAVGAALTALVLAREWHLSDLFCVPRGGSRFAGDVHVPTIGNLTNWPAFAVTDVVRARHVADLGGDARHPSAVVEL